MGIKNTPKQFNWSFEKRFMSKVEITSSGCWEWKRSKCSNGYGMMAVGGVRWMAHRYSYTTLVGQIPENHDLDHLCRNRSCTNPSHLEPVTRSVNLNRGIKKTQVPLKTHCPRGHEYTEQNTYVNGNRRSCRACSNERLRIMRKKKRENRNG